MLPAALKRMVPWRVRDLLSGVKARAVEAALALVTPRIPLPPSVAHLHVALLGASVGQDWRLRLVFPNVRASALYQFDKGPLVQRALTRRPDLVIIKECAAYFPLPDAEAGQQLVQGWVEQLRGAGIKVALATVAPVTRAHASHEPGRAEGLWAFNDWLRQFAADQGLPLLDLEAALRCSSSDRHLDPALHSGDGLHLARATYRDRLDSLIPALLLRASSD